MLLSKRHGHLQSPTFSRLPRQDQLLRVVAGQLNRCVQKRGDEVARKCQESHCKVVDVLFESDGLQVRLHDGIPALQG